MTRIYYYNKDNGSYIGQGITDGVIPPFSTTTPPPVDHARFNAELGVWTKPGTVAITEKTVEENFTEEMKIEDAAPRKRTQRGRRGKK